MLDTHILLWALAMPERLADNVRAPIVSPDNEVLVSVVSLWEIVIKVRIRKLKTDLAQVEHEMMTLGFELLPITSAHLAVLTGLPRHHGDPFDHLLCAQAISEDAVLVTHDQWMRRYPVNVL